MCRKERGVVVRERALLWIYLVDWNKPHKSWTILIIVDYSKADYFVLENNLKSITKRYTQDG